MTKRPLRNLLLTGALAVLLTAGTQTPGIASEDMQDYSPAERMLFMSEHLAGVGPSETLSYIFRRSGSLDAGFTDTVSIRLDAKDDGSCCIARGEFLSDARRVNLPEVEGASGNPVILYFLENDVRGMQRLTRGQTNHFRKRIRMAIYNGASIKETTQRYRGTEVPVRVVEFDPYLDDPNRHRFETYARKHYAFMLSDAVPGGVFGIRTLIAAEQGSAPPLVVEELFIDGAQPGDLITAKES